MIRTFCRTKFEKYYNRERLGNENERNKKKIIGKVVNGLEHGNSKTKMCENHVQQGINYPKSFEQIT